MAEEKKRPGGINARRNETGIRLTFETRERIRAYQKRFNERTGGSLSDEQFLQLALKHLEAIEKEHK